MGSGSQHAPPSIPVHCWERRWAFGGKVLGNDSENDKCEFLLTCIAVYAIDLGVAWPFKRRVVATSRRLAVISPKAFSESLLAEDGKVKMCRYAWNSPTVIHPAWRTQWLTYMQKKGALQKALIRVFRVPILSFVETSQKEIRVEVIIVSSFPQLRTYSTGTN